MSSAGLIIGQLVDFLKPLIVQHRTLQSERTDHEATGRKGTRVQWRRRHNLALSKVPPDLHDSGSPLSWPEPAFSGISINIIGLPTFRQIAVSKYQRRNVFERKEPIRRRFKVRMDWGSRWNLF
jgi:hypothetical protein